MDWNDYADIQAAIDCEDTFYEMEYNKVYTVSQLITQYRKGTLPNRIITVKDILAEQCESENDDEARLFMICNFIADIVRNDLIVNFGLIEYSLLDDDDEFNILSFKYNSKLKLFIKSFSF